MKIHTLRTAKAFLCSILLLIGSSSIVPSVRAADVLIVPSGNQEMQCQDASQELARVTNHIRDAEISFHYVPDAEDYYAQALDDICQAQYHDAMVHLREADQALHQIRNVDSVSPGY